MRRAALVALVLVAFPARGQLLYGPDSPTPIQRPYPSPQVWAPFNVAQCLPTGGIGDVTQGATITTTRASTQTVWTGTTLSTCPAASLAVGVQGAEVYAAGTNYARQSSTSCVGNAVQAPWAISGTPTCVSDVALAPDGTTTMDEWTNAAAGDSPYQASSAFTSTATYTGSVWMQKASAGAASLSLGFATSASGCACGTSDGSACTPSVYSTTFCKAVFTVGATPVRGWVSGTGGAAVTTAPLFLGPGNIGVSTGTARFWGAQVEPGLYPTPYVPTTTATASRAATVSTVPLPALHTTNTWCIGVTATPGQAWNVAPPGGLIWSNYAGALPNVMNLARNSTQVTFNLYDSAGAIKSLVWAHGLGASTASQRLVACNQVGIMSLYANGVLVVSGGVGAGTGLQSATVTPIQVGSKAGGTQFDGSLRDLRIYPNATYKAGM